jgi:hypothetical protein
MRQAFHIFQKDLRHLWKEIVAYGFLLLVYGVTKPMLWPGSNVDSTMAGAVMVLQILLPVTFFVLIVRVVQEERPAGVDQFWVTRPYRWDSLLLAKAIFVVTCVMIPFVLMQWWLLSRAGLGLLSSPTGMMRCLTMIALDAWLPFVLIGAVTTTVIEAFLVLIGIIAIWVTVLSTVFRSSDMRMPPPYSFEAMAVLFAGLLIGVVVYQYSRRQTRRSQVAFGAVAGLFLVLFYGFSGTHLGAPIRALIRSHYPLSQDAGLRLVVLPGPVPYTERKKEMNASRGLVELKVRVRLEGLNAGYKLHDTNVSYVIEAAGKRYVSPWQTAILNEDALSFVVPQEILTQVDGRKVQLRMELVGERLRPKMPEVITVNKSFNAPSNGRCVLVGAGLPVCRYAYRVDVPTRISAPADQGACEDTRKVGGPVYANLRQLPGGSTVDPVVQEELQLGKVCPGSEMTFSEYEPAGRFRLQIEVPAVDLGLLRARSF